MSAEELAWLERLRDRHPEFWGKAASVVSTLGEEQRAGLELRHLAGVVYAARFDAVALELGRRALAEGIEAELDGRRSVWRARSRAGGLRSEAIEGWRDEMSWGDLLLVRIAARLIGDADAEVRGALAALGDRDLADTTTEHGGVLDADERGGLVMYHYPPRPRDRVSDTRMVASDALIEGSATALFHFHMHARSYDSAEWAGPSAGDFAYAGAHGRSCVVFTFLDANTLNADYYQPAGLGRGGSAGLEGGATIDLGVIRRPTGG
jgi:hypothetical protein